jgi:hypothetical protein
MHVAVNQTGKQEFAMKIDALRILAGRLLDVAEITDGQDLASANRHGLGIRMVRIAGKNLCVE